MNRITNPPRLPPVPPNEIKRIQQTVESHLPAEFDREFIADTIIVDAWLKGVLHVSHRYIHNKCISAWRQREQERSRNRELSMIAMQNVPSSPETQPAEFAGQKILVDEIISCLSSYERKLVWYRFWGGQTLEEIAVSVDSSRERVQRELKVALYKMRLYLT